MKSQFTVFQIAQSVKARVQFKAGNFTAFLQGCFCSLENRFCVRGERILILSVPRDIPRVSTVMPHDFSVWTPSGSGTNNLDLM